MEEAGGQDWVAESRGTLGLGKALGLGGRGGQSRFHSAGTVCWRSLVLGGEIHGLPLGRV